MDFLSLAIEQSSEGIAVVDLDGNLEYLNDAFAEMHGYSPEELVGKNLSVFHSPQQMPSVKAASQEIKKTGVFKGEIWHLRRDSKEFPGLMHNSLVRDNKGKPIAMIATLRDITDIKRSEEGLKKSDQKYKTFMESIRDGVYILDEKGRFTFVNDVIVRRSKQTREWFLDKSYIDVIRPEDRERVRKNFEAVMRGEEVSAYELAYPTASGDDLWVEVNTTALRTDTGIIGLLGISRDITDRKLAEKRLEKARTELENRVEERTAELRKTTEQLNALMNATTDTVSLIDLKGYVVAANAVTAKRLGTTQDQLLGTFVYDLMPPSVARSRKAIANRVVKTGKPHRFEDERGGIVLDSTVYPVFDKDGKVVQLAIYAKNITKQVKAYQELKEKEKDLEEKTSLLYDANTALKIMLQKSSENRKEVEEEILAVLKKRIAPYISKLKQCNLDMEMRDSVHMLESNLKEIVSPFSRKLSFEYINLTPKEIQVANLIRKGKATKEISQILSLTRGTVDTHRNNIRKKLDLKNKKVTLKTYLMSLL